MLTTYFDYDGRGRLAQINHGSIGGHSYAYDEANRLTGYTNGTHSAESATYSYDNRNQLTGANRVGTANDETYEYDDNGNRTNGGFGVGTNNRITTDGTYNYTYDDEENIERRTRISHGSYTEYEWDHRNRLVSVTDRTSGGTQTQRVTYTYDAFNRLARRSFQTTGGGPVTTGFFIHDGDRIVLELDAGGGVAHRLLWGPAVDQALADETGSGDVYWYLTDHLGTVRDVVDYTGGATVVNHIAYDSFGRRTSETNSALGDFDLGFTGKWFDRATGLQWNLNRWYNPAIQRWMSEDSIGFAAGDANLSRYVGNEPTGWTDPSGLFGEDNHGAGYGGAVSDETWYERRKKIESLGFWGALGSSLSNSWRSMQNTYTALILDHVYSLEEEADSLMRNAYEMGPLGQTQDSEGIYYYGPRGALATSTVATVGAVGAEFLGPASTTFSRHALQRMAERGISRQSVLDAISKGRTVTGNTPGTTVYELPAAASSTGRGVIAVINNITGKVITVIDKGSKFK